MASTRVLCFHSVIIQLGDKRRSAFLNRMRSHQHSVNWSPPRLAAEHVQKKLLASRGFSGTVSNLFSKESLLTKDMFFHTYKRNQPGWFDFV